MKVLGSSHERDTQIVELEQAEFDSLAALAKSLLRARPRETPYKLSEMISDADWDEALRQAFTLIRKVAIAVGQKTMLEETIRSALELAQS